MNTDVRDSFNQSTHTELRILKNGEVKTEQNATAEVPNQTDETRLKEL